MSGWSNSILHLSKPFPLCSFSSAHMQLRLSSLICRIIVLQKYTVCFREEARLVSALMRRTNSFLDLVLLPSYFSALSCSQEPETGEGWPFFSLLHQQLLGGSVMVMMAWPGRRGAGVDMSPPWRCGASPPGSPDCYLLLQETCVDNWWQSCLLSPCRGSGVSLGPWPGLWLLKSHQLMQEGTNPTLKGVVLWGGPHFGWRVGGRAWVGVWVLAGPGGDGNRGGTAEVPYGLRFPCRRTASFTSRPSGSSSCPWRGRGWSHLTGTAHGGGFGSVGGFFISPERRWPWESCSELVVVETFCSLKEKLSPLRAVKEGGDAEGLSNRLISCCRNQEPSVLQKIKELWL